jgi:hypothetical protein
LQRPLQALALIDMDAFYSPGHLMKWAPPSLAPHVVARLLKFSGVAGSLESSFVGLKPIPSGAIVQEGSIHLIAPQHRRQLAKTM